MRVLGTAGHVDHGKSSLVLALTGINPDRLREEQERQMTIDLGFAWFTLPGGETIGIVDVPGHRDFIENMLAGVGSIDAALLVIAADEGVMPQTREHLAILDLLQIESGVVALSKVDLIEDQEWLELVGDDIRSLLHGTKLRDAPIVAVSANSGVGMQELITKLEEVMTQAPQRRDLEQPRLSIDRAFSIAGFGTVVTGTLVDGSLRVGDEIEILPQNVRGRIRGLQTHKSKIVEAVPGSRVAVNITGIDVDQISRGDVVVYPGKASGTRRIDVHFQLLKSSNLTVKHNQEVKLFIGAAQRIARIRLLGAKQIQPGEEGWLQLELNEQIVTARGDRYILRRPSPPATIGGGVVVDAHPERRHRRRDSTLIERLEKYLIGSPEEVLLQTIQRLGPADWDKIVDQAGLDAAEMEEARRASINNNWILPLGGSRGTEAIYVDQKTWEMLIDKTLAELENFHAEKKLRAGMSVEEMRSRLELEPKIANAVFNKAASQDLIDVSGQFICIKGFEPKLSEAQEQRVKDLLKRFKVSPFATPSVKETVEALGEDLFRYLLSKSELIQITDDVVFRWEDYLTMVEDVKALLKADGAVTVAEVRDHFKTSRKYALALMEHLDAEGVTIREGDLRRLARNHS